MFDAKAGTLVSNPVVLIKGDRITDVGANVQIPEGARVIDLGAATMMPGMIDAHVHVNTGGNAASLAARALRALANAQIDLDVGFTTVLDMDSRGGFYTVDLRDAINNGSVRGPRMQVVGQSLNPRATNYYPDNQSVRILRGLYRKQERQRAVARALSGARGEAAWRRLHQDLHHAGLRRHRAHVEAGRDAGQQSVADAGGGQCHRG